MSNGTAGKAQAVKQKWSHRAGLWVRRASTLALACAITVGVSGCGGGAELTGDGFSIGLSIDGQPYGSTMVSGTRQSVSIYAGQSVAFDASEAVQWTLYAGNAAIPANGSTVYYSGASIRATAVSRSRIVVDTAAAGSLPQPVPVTLIATSTYDSALITTVTVYLF